MNASTKQKANQLVKEMVIIENSILEIMNNNQSVFDVYQDEEYGWIIQTSYCQIGGCLSGFISAEDEEKARKIAAKMTYFGQKPSSKGLCSDCRREFYDM